MDPVPCGFPFKGEGEVDVQGKVAPGAVFPVLPVLAIHRLSDINGSLRRCTHSHHPIVSVKHFRIEMSEEEILDEAVFSRLNPS